ncbi:MAG: thermonuclease family protein [Akkermansiaceae bacterium]
MSASVANAGKAEMKVYEGCRWVNENGNDGDSFSVEWKDPKNPKVEKKKMVIRLYGVDCMETSDVKPHSIDRLVVQGLYFGIHKKDMGKDKFKWTKKLGSEATAFTRNKLRGKPFTVTTWHEHAMGQRKGRIYAYVTTSKGEDLGELLVRNGLARIHGKIHKHSVDEVEQGYSGRLKAQEILAIAEKNGAWKHTDWKLFAEERAKYQKFYAKLYINRLKDTEFHKTLIMQRTGVNKKIAKALLNGHDKGKNPYKDIADIDKRVLGVGKTRAKELGKIFLFD